MKKGDKKIFKQVIRTSITYQRTQDSTILRLIVNDETLEVGSLEKGMNLICTTYPGYHKKLLDHLITSSPYYLKYEKY